MRSRQCLDVLKEEVNWSLYLLAAASCLEEILEDGLAVKSGDGKMLRLPGDFRRR